MFRFVFRAALAVFLACAAGASYAQPAPPPVAAYGRLPAISDAAISPDGRHIIIAQSDASATAFRIIEVDTQRSVYAARIEGQTRLRGVGWADDNTATFTVSTAVNPGFVLGGNYYMRGQQLLEYWRLGAYSLATGRQFYLLADTESAWMNQDIAHLHAPIEGDPGYGRMVGSVRQGSESVQRAIYRVNLTNGHTTVVGHGNNNVWNFLFNEHGEVVARTEAEARSAHWRLFVVDGGQSRLLKEDDSEFGTPPPLWGLLGDGRIVTSMVSEDSDRSVLTAINPANGEMATVAESPRYDIDFAISDPWTDRVVGARWTEDFPRQRFFDPDLERVRLTLGGMFSDGFALILSWSRDKSRFVIFGETARDGGGYYLFEPQTGAILQLGLRYPELTGADFGQRQAISFTARDGHRIPAYLSTPTNAGPTTPLIVLPHGGPSARDDFSFDWLAAFLVSRGYAVIQPNYRGSDGYGRAWEHAGRGAWGDGVIQTDVVDAADAMVRAGRADPHRICIVGWSYGGYAALVGATLTPDKFACAVSMAGLSDLPQFIADTAESTGNASPASRQWRAFIGDRVTDLAHLRDISPAMHAADVRAPILLMHGVQDTTVPISQTRIMRDALQRAGKDVRYVEFPGDDHQLLTASMRTQMLTELEQFLAAHLHP